MIVHILTFIAAYLFGSLSSAILLCRVMHLPDPRTQGSGNPGATNVLRFGGKKLAALVLVGDALKAIIPVLLAKWLFGTPWVTNTTALCVLIGHVYPIFFQFKGGKGVATYLGGLLGGYPLLFLVGAATWISVAVTTRYSSLAALVMSLVVVIVSLFIIGIVATIPLLAMTLLLVFRHRKNIERLRAGQESKIGQP